MFSPNFVERKLHKKKEPVFSFKQVYTENMTLGFERERGKKKHVEMIKQGNINTSSKVC